MNKVLITGFSGCIGAATIDYLFAHGADEVIGLSRSGSCERLSESAAGRVQIVRGDIAHADELASVVARQQPTQMIHLAGLQTPDCQAHPFRGMDINLIGSVNVFKAAATLGDHLQRMVFASSSAVYGPRTLYPGPTVKPTDPYLPPNLYGYWKTAGEGMAQAFHMETGVPTVSLRLSTTYGPGRDLGLTSAPTTALKALALGLEYAIPYDGRETYHYVGDVGAGFGEAALAPFEGYGVFNLRGTTIHTHEFVTIVEGVCEELGRPCTVRIRESPDPYPFACDLDDELSCAAFPEMRLTPMASGIRQSLLGFDLMVQSGKLAADEVPVQA
jgi:UDP-glucose 4-epimerase